MLKDIWSFLSEESNRNILTFVGTGLAAGAAGVWAVITFFSKRRKKSESSRPSVQYADHGVVARDITDATITIGLDEQTVGGRIDDARQKIVDHISGGDAFAAVFFPEIDGKHWIVLRNFGSHALRHLRVMAAPVASSPQPPIFQFVCPSLPPREIDKVAPIEFRADEGGFQVNFNGENGFWGEAVKFRRIGGSLRFAIKVWKLGKGDQIGQILTLYLDAHPEYPREHDGTLDMSFGPPIDLSTSTPSTESPEEGIKRSLGMR